MQDLIGSIWKSCWYILFFYLTASSSGMASKRRNKWPHFAHFDTRTRIYTRTSQTTAALFELCSVILRRFRKIVESFVMSVRPPLCSHGTTRFPLDGLSLNLIFVYFSQICPKDSSFIKIWQKKGYFTRRPIQFIIIPRSDLLTISNVSDKSCRENRNTHFVFNAFFFF